MSNTTLKHYPKGQPKAFYLLFFIEMWERFGYYAMRALLVLYMSNVFHFSDSRSFAVFGAFAALVYVTPTFGGWIGDHIIGYRRALVLGAAMLSAGYFMLMISGTHYFYLGLGMVIVGNGFFKPSPASLLGKIYGADDPRIESGYTMFYMSINIGSFIGIALSGFVAHRYGWSLAFSLSAIGLLLSFASFILGIGMIKNAGSKADLEPLKWRHLPWLAFGTVAAVLGAAELLQHTSVSQIVLYGTCALAALYLCYLAYKLEGQERNRLIASLVLIVVAIVFFALYFQAPMSLNLFTERNVQRHIFGLYIPTSTFQSLNPFFIVVLAPLFSEIYKHLGRRDRSVSLPMKFAVGTLLVGVGFLVLKWCVVTADKNGLVSAWWIFASYGIQSAAELLVSALGVAMIAKLAPQKYLGLMMGAWYLSAAVAASLGGTIAQWASIASPEKMTAFQSLHIYTHTFAAYGWLAIAISAIVFALVPWLKRMIA